MNHVSNNPKLQSKRANISFIWDWLLISAIQQTVDSCSYAATALHISYNLIICYLRTAVGPISLPPGMLVDYVRWERDIIAKEGQKLTFVWYLLEDAKLNGVPLWSGPRVKIDQRCHFNLKIDVHGNNMRQQLNCSTIVAVFNIHEDYDENGALPYMGRGGVLYEENGVDKKKHAIVIVGEYLDIDNSIFLEGEARERLWIYQNSHGDPSMHMLGNGLSVVKHSLITEAYCAETYATSVLLGLPDAQTVMPMRHEEHQNLRYE